MLLSRKGDVGNKGYYRGRKRKKFHIPIRNKNGKRS